MAAMNDPLAHTSPWAVEQNFWLEGPNFYRAHMADDAVMWFSDRAGPLRGEAILDAIKNVPRWEAVVFADKEIAVDGDRIVLRYHATAQADGLDVYSADCSTTYLRETGGLTLIEHRQRAA